MARTREQKKKEFIGHLGYEEHMLLASFNLIQTKSDEMNALIESFAIHARALLEFFEVIKAKGATASDFTIEKYTPKFVDKVKPATIQKLHNQIAHLSIERTEETSEKLGGPDRLELLNLIKQELFEFVKHLRPEYSPVQGLRPEGSTKE